MLKGGADMVSFYLVQREERLGRPAWSALMPRNRSLPFILGISKSRIARSKVERSERNACIGQLSNTTE
jgi:hypothetical protein